ncbi:outer membrane beta-barrel protein [Colwellia sp. TT2012]|uniref:outer membrane beta-barrel protein n=1 Tax=Colwellia sp. TT2012 TaxID=1720342 RepID=UPI00070DE186|nr:outer membrane beta-barrel protein [Colwellia sp. TT2012]
MIKTRKQAIKQKLIKTFSKILPLSLLTLATQAFADTTYIGIDYMLTDIELASENAKPSAIAIRAGVSNNNMAFEAQYLVGNTDDVYRMAFDLEQSVALYFVMQSDIRDGFGMDVSVGYAMTDMTVSGPEETYNGEDHYNGFSWGISMHQQIPYFEQASIRLGYQSLYKDSDIEITNISLGFTYTF